MSERLRDKYVHKGLGRNKLASHAKSKDYFTRKIAREQREKDRTGWVRSKKR